MRPLVLAALAALTTLAGGPACRGLARPPPPTLDEAAAEYLRLADALGRHDRQSIDWRIGTPDQSDLPLHDIAERSRAIVDRLKRADLSEIDDLRRLALSEQFVAIAVRAEHLGGAHLPIRDELERVYDLVPPRAPELDGVRAELDRMLPGKGALPERLLAYESRLLVPRERLPAVMARALEGCRVETLKHLALPAGERMSIAFTSGRPWSAYSHYDGNFHSVVEVNTDFRLSVDRALTLACHEGYPGHHAINSVREWLFVRERRWAEFEVLPLFSPQGFAGEALANAAGAVAFPEGERAAFARDELFPLAGLDSQEAERHVRITRLVERLEDAIAPVGMDYVDGHLTLAQASRKLEREAAMATAEATLKFLDTFRAYGMSYNFGRSLAARAIDADEATRSERWRTLAALIRSPSPLRNFAAGGRN